MLLTRCDRYFASPQTASSTSSSASKNCDDQTDSIDEISPTEKIMAHSSAVCSPPVPQIFLRNGLNALVSPTTSTSISSRLSPIVEPYHSIPSSSSFAYNLTYALLTSRTQSSSSSTSIATIKSDEEYGNVQSSSQSSPLENMTTTVATTQNNNNNDNNMTSSKWTIESNGKIPDSLCWRTTPYSPPNDPAGWKPFIYSIPYYMCVFFFVWFGVCMSHEQI